VTRARDFLGPYRLVRLIRVGNTCQVWEAAKTDEATHYALKVLREDLRKNRSELAALRNEWDVGGKLKHANIIKLHEYNREASTPYLVLELFEYPNLKLLLRQGHQSLAYLVPKIIEQAAEALFYMHGEGWVHCDVKPDNFLVNEDGVVKLIDFAISRRIKRGLSALFSFGGGKVQGTRSYMSPEQIRGKSLDERSDVYSFGCVVVELLTGKPPFTGSTADELLSRHLTAPVPSLMAANDNVTPELANLVRRAMAKRRDDRHRSMYDFLMEFRALRVFKINPKPPASKIIHSGEVTASVEDLFKNPSGKKG
jgi:eukaryotic-like serine/threonine-protein kinase